MFVDVPFVLALRLPIYYSRRPTEHAFGNIRVCMCHVTHDAQAQTVEKGGGGAGKAEWFWPPGPQTQPQPQGKQQQRTTHTAEVETKSPLNSKNPAPTATSRQERQSNIRKKKKTVGTKKRSWHRQRAPDDQHLRRCSLHTAPLSPPHQPHSPRSPKAPSPTPPLQAPISFKKFGVGLRAPGRANRKYFFG